MRNQFAFGAKRLILIISLVFAIKAYSSPDYYTGTPEESEAIDDSISINPDDPDDSDQSDQPDQSDQSDQSEDDPDNPDNPDDPEVGDSVKAPLRNWFKIYYREDGLKRIRQYPVNTLDSLYFTGKATEEKDSASNTPVRVTETEVDTLNLLLTNGNVTKLPFDSVTGMHLGTNIPTLYIDTEPYVSEIRSKTEYMAAHFRFVPYDGGDTIENMVDIRGRGNTSWSFPKKPYRLKFNKKQSIPGLEKAKSFVLLSNYIDNILMKNAIAFKVAELLGLPYTNKVVPVNLVFNGMERGNYMLTNKVGINSGSVDIDENEGILWELDTYFDEEFRFRSANYDIPCMVKDPDFHEIYYDDPELIEENWTYWKDDIEKAFEAVRNGNWTEAFDADQFVRYILANHIVSNGELAWPKSMYLYKENREEKYKLGPVWDFDWALGYSKEFDNPLIENITKVYGFYKVIFNDEDFRTLFQAQLDDFIENGLDELMLFIDEYAALISDSAMADAMRWPAEHYHVNYEREERNATRFGERVEGVKQLILNRLECIRNSSNFLLY